MNILKFKDFFTRKKDDLGYEFLRTVPEEKYEYYLKKLYKEKMGIKLNLKHPKRFTEKIQYLKLNDNMLAKERYVNKVTARDYFLEKIGEPKYLKEIIGIYNTFEEIDFSKLPDKFFMQTNHGAKMLIKIKNKDLFLKEGYTATKNQFTGWLNYNFAFCAGFELQYKNIKPQIIIEKLYENDDKSPITDYMIFCFQGEPKFAQTVVYSSTVRNNKLAFYDLDWNVYPCCQIEGLEPYPVKRPVNFNKMLEIAKILSKDFKFVRVDFMEVNNDLYFLELTFTPNSGFVGYIPDKYDFIFGEFLHL